MIKQTSKYAFKPCQTFKNIKLNKKMKSKSNNRFKLRPYIKNTYQTHLSQDLP